MNKPYVGDATRTYYVMEGVISMKPKTIKIVSMGVSAVSALVSFGVSAWEDKKLDITIDNKVAEKVAEALKQLNK